MGLFMAQARQTVAARATPAATTTIIDSTTTKIPTIPMTVQGINCPAPILTEDFSNCRVPGGVEMWASGGFYSPGVCFVGYQAQCTQTKVAKSEYPIQSGETVVRCIPSGYECNDQTKDQKYAVSKYGSIVLSAPAFEIRWREQDLQHVTGPLPPPTIPTRLPSSSTTPGSVAVVTWTVTSTDSSPTETASAASSSKSIINLSDGAVAGVAVGIFFAISFLVIGFLYSRRYIRRRNRNAFPSEKDQGSTPDDAPALLGSIELENRVRVELSAQAAPAELSVQRSSKAPPSGYWRASHISVNKDPVEMPADPA